MLSSIYIQNKMKTKKTTKFWGEYIILEETSSYKSKIIVYPNQRISYQYHTKRSEIWIVVRELV